jgi:hypothetical protein
MRQALICAVATYSTSQVGALISSQFNGCSGWTPVKDSWDLRAQLLRFNDLWDLLAPLLRMPRVYFLVTGKQATFALAGYGQLRVPNLSPPTDHVPLVLGSLSAESIHDTFKRTLADGLPVTTYVDAATPELLVELCSEMGVMTGGLPRLVYYTFLALCRLQQEKLLVRSRQDIQNVLERAYKHIMTYLHLPSLVRYLSFPACAKNGPVSSLYAALLLASFLGMKVNTRTSLVWMERTETEGIRLLPLLQVVDRHDLYLDSRDCAPGMAYLRFPKWGARILKEDRKSLHVCLRAVLPLWDAPPQVMRKGYPLEYFFYTRVATLLLQTATGGQTGTWADAFPVFRGTLLAQRSIPVLNSEQPVRLLPKVTRDSPHQLELAGGWAATMGTADWAALCEGAGETSRFPIGTIGYTPPKSRSPRLVVRCSERFLLAVQCRFGEEMTWARVQKEVKKAAHLINASDNGCEVCLVLLSFALATELEDAIGNDAATIASGRWGLTGRRLQKLPAAASSAGKRVVLQVPENMQLVVLGFEGRRSFLGEEADETFQDLAEHPDQPDGFRPYAASLRINAGYSGSSIRSGTLGAWKLGAAAAAARPFDVETFLRDEAGLEEDEVKGCLPLLQRQNLTAKKLPALSDDLLKRCGILSPLSRACILKAR